MNLIHSKIKGRLTERKLKELDPDIVFAFGTFSNKLDEVFMSREDRELYWVAKRGGGYDDWAIYCSFKHDVTYTSRYGQKVTGENNINKLVPCDESALKLYRR